MNTAVTLQIDSTSLEDSLALGSHIGERLKGGETIVLRADLGGGKTAFVRGVARGFGSKDNVTSPSFTLSNEYTRSTDELRIAHYDFYRLEEAGVLGQELDEHISESETVVVIEWADIVMDGLPTERVIVDIAVTGEQSRSFSLSVPPAFSHLVEGLK